jgi:predicted regulator of Ras-like GTPase activity (Roadblock/LC7/MglB family)
VGDFDNTFSLALEEFNNSVREIATVALISNDGLPIATSTERDFDQDSVTAILSSFHQLSESTLKEFANAPTNEVIITSDNGLLLVLNLAANDAVLYIFATDAEKTGYILYRAREFKRELDALFA